MQNLSQQQQQQQRIRFNDAVQCHRDDETLAKLLKAYRGRSHIYDRKRFLDLIVDMNDKTGGLFNEEHRRKVLERNAAAEEMKTREMSTMNPKKRFLST